MNREIKFRAWNTHTKTMIDLKKITPLALDQNIGECDGLFLPFQDVFILMQYTGLKDKNGKEIYEGDIVNYMFDYDDEKLKKKAKRYIGHIAWCAAHCSFEISSTIEDHHGLVFNAGHFCQIEIIGNIYKDYNLLNKKKKKL